MFYSFQLSGFFDQLLLYHENSPKKASINFHHSLLVLMDMWRRIASNADLANMIRDMYAENLSFNNKRGIFTKHILSQRVECIMRILCVSLYRHEYGRSYGFLCLAGRTCAYLSLKQDETDAVIFKILSRCVSLF